MLPAVIKLCCGISYPHMRSMAGLQRTAVAVIGQKIQREGWGSIPCSIPLLGRMGSAARTTFTESKTKESKTFQLKEDELFYVHQGQEAMNKALRILEDKEGWKPEIVEDNGDVICSKVMPGASKVFRLEAVFEASPDDLYEILFVNVEEMHKWNPNIQHIKVLKHVGPETMVTHEVSAETAGNLIGQRDFLSVRHSCKHKSRIYLGGGATQLESFPAQKGFVRAEDGPTCFIIESQGPGRSRVTWLVNMDIKGWLPKSIVNQALPSAQLDFTRHLRRHLTAGGVLD